MSVIMTYLLHFLCLCNYENRMRFGMVELETGIPFVSALTFRYLWQKSQKNRECEYVGFVEFVAWLS